MFLVDIHKYSDTAMVLRNFYIIYDVPTRAYTFVRIYTLIYIDLNTYYLSLFRNVNFFRIFFLIIYYSFENHKNNNLSYKPLKRYGYRIYVYICNAH